MKCPLYRKLPSVSTEELKYKNHWHHFNKEPFKKYVRSEGGKGEPNKAYEKVRGEEGLFKACTYVRPRNFQTLVTCEAS